MILRHTTPGTTVAWLLFWHLVWPLLDCSFVRYNERVVWNDKQLNLKLLRKGVLTRIYAPMVHTKKPISHTIKMSVICKVIIFICCAPCSIRRSCKACGSLAYSPLSLQRPWTTAKFCWRKSLTETAPIPTMKIYRGHSSQLMLGRSWTSSSLPLPTGMMVAHPQLFLLCHPRVWMRREGVRLSGDFDRDERILLPM